MLNKRSFFEKLTGAVKLDDDGESMDDSSELKTNDKSSHLSTDRDRWGEKSNMLDEETDEEAQLTVDVYRTPSEIIIKTMVAGVKPENLDVSITRDSVTIRGNRSEDRTVSSDEYFHRELYWGSFARTINLPEEVDVDGAEAVEKYGMLILHLPKLDKNRQAKLKVKGG